MKNKLKYMILIGIIAIITVPVLLMAFYAVPYNDDFSTIGDVLREMEKSGKGITTSALLLTLGRFKTWGGFYTGSFLNYAINPYMRWGMPGHQITVFLTTLFFIVTLLVFVRVMMKEIFGVESRIKGLVLGTAMLVCFFDLYYYTETMYWYCTAVSYVLILAFMFWGIIWDARYINTGKKRYAVLAVLTGFLTSGGALNLVALNCEMALLLIGYEWIEKKGKRAWLYFAGSLAGGLLNACAPGNFVRNNGTAGTAQILQAIALSAEHVVHRGYYLLKYTPFLAVIAVVFLYMLKYVKLENRSIRLYHLGLLAVLIVAGGTAVAFPVMLGHGENYYPDRCLFIDDCLIYIGTFLFLLLFAQWCRNVGRNKRTVLYGFITAGMLVWGGVFWGSIAAGTENMLTVKCIKEIADGTAQKYFSYWDSALHEIKTAEDTHVVVVRKEEEHESSILQGISLTPDTGDWVNKAVAACYDKEDVQYIIE